MISTAAFTPRPEGSVTLRRNAPLLLWPKSGRAQNMERAANLFMKSWLLVWPLIPGLEVADTPRDETRYRIERPFRLAQLEYRFRNRFVQPFLTVSECSPTRVKILERQEGKANISIDRQEWIYADSSGWYNRGSVLPRGGDCRIFDRAL